MAPKELVGRYKQYKHGTQDLVYWLTKTAAECGDLGDVVSSLGKVLPARPSGHRFAVPDLEVRSHEIVTLAQQIANSKKSVEIPEGILLILRDVIAGRKGCAAWYDSQADGEGSQKSKADEGHQAFIEVLETVHSILAEARSRNATADAGKKTGEKPKSSKASGKTADKLSGAFGSLGLEEPSAQFLGDADAPEIALKTPTGGPTKVRVKLEQQNDEADFEVWCFLQDLYDIRMFSTTAWKDYSKGELSSITASLVTSAALGLLRRAEEDFGKASRLQSTEWTSILAHLGIRFFARGDAIWLTQDPSCKSKAPRAAGTVDNVVELLCPIAFYVLVASERDVQACCKTNDLGAAAGTFHHRFGRPLYYLAPRIDEIAHHRARCIVMDEFTEGLVQIHNAGKIPVWMVIAAQMQMDIYDLLEDDIDEGGNQLLAHLRGVVRLFDSVKAYEKSSNNKDCFFLDSNKPRAELEAMASWANECLNRKGSSEGPIDWTDHVQVMQRGMPAFAGTILAENKLSIYQTSSALSSHGRYILSAAHLYKALRACNMLKPNWQDMDFVLTAFGSKPANVAKAGRPYDGEKTKDHWLLDIGFNMADMKDITGGMQSGKTHLRMKNQPKTVTITSTLLQALGDQPSRDLRQTSVGQVRSESLEYVLRGLLAEEATKGSKGLKSISHLHDSFTATQLLTTLKQTLVHDEPALNFDYINFTISCARLIKQIAADVLGVTIGPEDIRKDDRHMPVVLGLLTTVGANKRSQDLSRVLEAHIESEGNTYVKQAYNQSSGRIPKSLRPKVEHDLQSVVMRTAVLRTMFEYIDAKYMFSGHTMAVYHPNIKPEEASAESNYCSTSKGAETDPKTEITYSNGGKMVIFGTTIPKSLMVDIDAKREANPEPHNNARRRMMEFWCKENDKGKYPEHNLRQYIRAETGHEIVRLNTLKNITRPDTPENKRQEWVFKVDPDNNQPLLNTIVKALGPIGPAMRPVFEDYWLPVPIDLPVDMDRMRTSGGVDVDRMRAGGDVDLARCAHAVYEERYAREPRVVEARLARAAPMAARRRLVEGDLEGFWAVVREGDGAE